MLFVLPPSHEAFEGSTNWLISGLMRTVHNIRVIICMSNYSFFFLRLSMQLPRLFFLPRASVSSLFEPPHSPPSSFRSAHCSRLAARIPRYLPTPPSLPLVFFTRHAAKALAQPIFFGKFAKGLNNGVNDGRIKCSAVAGVSVQSF